MSIIQRRNFLQTLLVSTLGTRALPGRAEDSIEKTAGTHYIAAYDTESGNCLAACRKIVEVHKRFEMPATFFIVGKTLEANPKEYRELLDDPLFEVASHTYSHRMLRDNPICGPAISLADKREEIFKGKELVEKYFQRPCLGLRPGCGFDQGFRKDKESLALIEEAGYVYTSSLLWGPDYSLPAMISDPFTYEPEGYPSLWELPGHGWHENLLKNNNKMGPKRITLWPPEMPEAIPTDYIKTPEQEFQINRVFLDRGKETGKKYVTLIWHPWSLMQFDPEMKMLELTFAYVREQNLMPCTFQGLYEQLIS
jgi:peptidoglycan/xylan/chitin deacetylase (PgdA/CDA1 family)